MSTPNYTKDYNPLRITDLWKYERPKYIIREDKKCRKSTSMQKKEVKIYDSVEDKELIFESQAECCRVAGITKITLYYLINGLQTSAMAKRYYRSKEDYLNTQGESVNFFDIKTGKYVHFSSTSEAASTLGITWNSVNNLLIGKTSMMLGRYTLVK